MGPCGGLYQNDTIYFLISGREGEERGWRGEEESRRRCQKEDDFVQPDLLWIQSSIFILLRKRNCGTVHQEHQMLNCGASFPADTEWNEETNREREEEKDPERATQGVEHWPFVGGQSQVSPCLTLESLVPWVPPSVWEFLLCRVSGKKLRSCGRGYVSWRQRSLTFSISARSRNTRSVFLMWSSSSFSLNHFSQMWIFFKYICFLNLWTGHCAKKPGQRSSENVSFDKCTMSTCTFICPQYQYYWVFFSIKLWENSELSTDYLYFIWLDIK